VHIIKQIVSTYQHGSAEQPLYQCGYWLTSYLEEVIVGHHEVVSEM